MFKELGQIASLMKNAGKIREEMEGLKSRMSAIVADGEAGGGMVKARVNGAMEVQKITISDDALKDRELLEDLVVAAVNQAMARAKETVAQETRKMATGLGLPAGMDLPGIG